MTTCLWLLFFFGDKEEKLSILPCFHPKMDGKGKKGHVENNNFQSKNKSDVKFQVKLMIQARWWHGNYTRSILLGGKMNYQHDNP
jgi:hypothetical protein